MSGWKTFWDEMTKIKKLETKPSGFWTHGFTVLERAEMARQQREKNRALNPTSDIYGLWSNRRNFTLIML